MKSIFWTFCLLAITVVSAISCSDSSSSSSNAAGQAKCSNLTHLIPVAGSCYNEPSCNPCDGNGTCVAGTANGAVYASGTTYVDSKMCTIACSSNTDCQSLNYVTANPDLGASTAKTRQTWSCNGSYCAVKLEIISTPSNCPSGCGGINTSICCKPPYCDGECVGSPCCN